MNYEHKGIQISFNDKGANFSATMKTKRIVAPSLAAVKKQIDAELDLSDSFKPFAVIEVDTYHDAISESKAVALEKVRKTSRYSNSGEFEFTMQGGRYGSTTRSAVIADTPENRKIAKAYLALHTKNKKEIERLTAEQEAARKGLPHISADDVATGKVKP